MSDTFKLSDSGLPAAGARRRADTWEGAFCPLLLAVVTLLAGAPPALAEKELVEGIVVRVNERILTTRDFGRRVSEKLAETGRPVEASEYPRLIEEAVDDFCLLERAAELKMEIEDEEVDAAVRQLREQNQIPDDAAFEQSLKSMGMTLTQLKAKLRDTMLINRLLSREVGPLPVTEAELQQRYQREKEQYRIPEGVKLQHVIMTVGPDDGAEGRAVEAAARLAAAARAGQDFAKLVDEQVAAGAASGGDLGLVNMPDLRKEVADAIAPLKAGEISAPFTTANGVHVVRVVERVPAGVRPFSEVADELRQRELNDRYRGRMNGIVEGLKKRYVIETHPELVYRPR